VLKGYKLVHVPINQQLRDELDKVSHEELTGQLSQIVRLHNTTDTSTKKRAIRALEIARYYEDNQIVEEQLPKINTKIFGISWERSELKQRITTRLKQRLEQRMIEEVEGLLKSGIPIEKLKFYGLEYKFISQYLSGELNYNDMYQKLNTAIHQFAKRQMTWFRRMEKNGFIIRWIDGMLPLEKKLEIITSGQ
jgi:tRNA dimethylallyltransferase